MTLANGAEQHGVKLEFIKPGKPMQNGFIEPFNRSYREGARHVCVSDLSEVREQTEKWITEYNEERPLGSLVHLTPREYLSTARPECLLMSGLNLVIVTLPMSVLGCPPSIEAP